MDNNAPPPPVAMASFYDRPEIKRRQGGIDVSKHSKVFLFGKQSMKEVGMTKSTTSFFLISSSSFDILAYTELSFRRERQEI